MKKVCDNNKVFSVGLIRGKKRREQSYSFPQIPHDLWDLWEQIIEVDLQSLAQTEKYLGKAWNFMYFPVNWLDIFGIKMTDRPYKALNIFSWNWNREISQSPGDLSKAHNPTVVRWYHWSTEPSRGQKEISPPTIKTLIKCSCQLPSWLYSVFFSLVFRIFSSIRRK